MRDGGWDRLDDEARKERQASQRKIKWLRTHVYLSEPTVVFLEEVTGSLADVRIGLRRTFTRLGYATLMLHGAGRGAGTELSQANGTFAAVRKGSAPFVGGAWRVAARCLGVQIKHTRSNRARQSETTSVHARLHHPVAQAEASERFESQLRSSLDWLEQRSGGLLLGDFNRVVCRKWRLGTSVRLNSSDRALRQAARWGCECCARDDDPDAEERMVRGPGGYETPTRYSTEFGKWGAGTARIDGAISVGSEEGRWVVVEEVFPEQSGRATRQYLCLITYLSS